MPRLVNGHVAVAAAVLVIALSSTGAQAQDLTKCTSPDFTADFCPYGYEVTMVALVGEQIDTAPTLNDCCTYTLNCKELDEGYCPYGYAPLTTSPGSILTGFTIEKCCGRDGTASFPVCSSVTNGAVQAPDAGDTNWAIQDNSGFVRTVGQYTGMCFSVTINNDCSFGDDTVASKCCAGKAPAFMSFKIPTLAAVTGEERANVFAAAKFKQCKVAYGSPTTTARSVKRIGRWTSANINDDTQFFNVPLTFRRGQKQTTVCMYTLNQAATKDDVDCSWEHICGLAVATGTPPVPDADTGSYALGCEVRLIGRRATSSSLCCSPTMSVEDFESGGENRLAAATSTAATIELIGH
jgi:hypothetical protein